MHPHSRNSAVSRFFGRIRIPALVRLGEYLGTRSPGDRVIASVLGGLVILTSLISVYALERSFLVRVPADGGSLTEGVVGTARFVNPLLAQSDTDRDLVALTYAGLMGRAGSGGLVPVLASGYTLSSDGLVYTFTLRDGITFSDGTPVTADDVVFTVEKAQDPALKSAVYADWANIRAEVVDARTVRFTLPKPYGPFIEDTTLGILPSHLWQDVRSEEFPFVGRTLSPVGAGPFTVDSISRASDGTITEYSLRAFDGYALGRPHLDALTITFFGNQSDLVAAVENGNVDSAYGVASDTALRTPYARVFGVFWNAEKIPALKDETVRHALSLAIDRSAITEGILGGYGIPTFGPLPASRDAIVSTPANRIEAATVLLTSAGWERASGGTGLWKKGDATLEIELKTSNVPELKTIASSIQKDWEALGVPTTIVVYAPNELTQDVIRPREYSALLFGEVIGTDPDLYAFWSTSERADPGLNIAGYSDQAVDALLEKARTLSPDSPAKKQALAQIEERISGSYAAAFTHTPEFAYAVPENLGGVVLPPISFPSDRFATVSGWYRRTELVWPFFVRHTVNE